jgi:hypothetical protein
LSVQYFSFLLPSLTLSIMIEINWNSCIVVITLWSWNVLNQCANGITDYWFTGLLNPSPLVDYWLGVYYKTFLEYFKEELFKKCWKIWKFSSHYYVMVYINVFLKIFHFQKNQVHLQVLLLLTNTSYVMFSKCYFH